MKKPCGKSVGFDHIQLTNGFWKQKQDLFLHTTIDAIYDRFEETGRFDALKFDWKEGMPNKPHIFWESDATKWIEGAAYFLKQHPNTQLEQKIDELVERMAKNQEENGYLNAYFTVVEPDARFQRRTDHELYCVGHLIEGALAYAEATGKVKMLEVAKKYVDLVDQVFRVEHSAAFDTPGHQEIELALYKLYDYTGEERYKLLAEYFLETRGKSEKDVTYSWANMEYMQSHLPVRNQKTAEGHSVRACYMYCGMADLARHNQDQEMFEACKALFDNITNRRMYITGGIGSTHYGESFSYDYHLPDYTAYAETCASISLAMFSRRMWLMEADGKYADAAELALYNTVMAGVSLSGDSFFYENPLAADPKRVRFNQSRPQELQEYLPILQRVKVFGCSCCPPNLLRIVGSIGDYMYSMTEDILYTQCYMSGIAQISHNGKTVAVEQKTGYPYDGNIQITIKEDADFDLALRIPGWCHSYHLTRNGEDVVLQAQKGFITLKAPFYAGDQISLSLDMPIRLVEANPNVVDLCGRVAVMCGPIVFCAEEPEGDYSLRNVRLSRNHLFEKGSIVIEGTELPVIKAEATVRIPSDHLYQDQPYMRKNTTIQLVPYHAWANRGVWEMTVWMLGQD